MFLGESPQCSETTEESSSGWGVIGTRTTRKVGVYEQTTSCSQVPWTYRQYSRCMRIINIFYDHATVVSFLDNRCCMCYKNVSCPTAHQKLTTYAFLQVSNPFWKCSYTNIKYLKSRFSYTPYEWFRERHKKPQDSLWLIFSFLFLDYLKGAW